MRFTADPRVGAAVSLVLAVVGGVMVVGGRGDTAGWAWLLVGVGVLGVVANVGIYLRTRGQEQGGSPR